MSKNSIAKTLVTTSIAIFAFAANSIFCRLALGERSIDASSFTVIRLFSGALALLIIMKFFGENEASDSKGSWSGASMLFLYASTFSFAYVSLDTATGALILFGAVQFTMIAIALISGDRLSLGEWVGVTVAFSGFIFLVMPMVTTPSLMGFVLMTTAGVAWGIYTLMGRRSRSPLMDTTYNFSRALPFIIVMGLFFIQNTSLTQRGVVLAVLSGAVASGVGYTIWYIALGGLSTTLAALAQLLVPVIAALGGMVFVSEPVSFRFVLSALMVLGGIALVVFGKRFSTNSKAQE